VEKGIDTAIRAAGASGVPLRIAGEGPAAAELAALANDVGAPVELIGRVGRSALRALVAEAAAVLLPSRYHEFSPFAALEAMASGVPVVAARMGGLPELVGEESCVPANDATAMAERLRALWDDPDLRRTEGERLLARVREQHSEERFVSRLLELYSRVRAG
jgi:glycosyltransferase involved in cell wall biosynthesis